MRASVLYAALRRAIWPFCVVSSPSSRPLGILPRAAGHDSSVMMIGLRASPPRRISRRVRWTISTTRLTLSATGTVPSVNGCTESTSKYLRAWAR